VTTVKSQGGRRGRVRVKYPGYRRPPVTIQNFRYDRFPPVANDWRTIHAVPDKTILLQLKRGTTNLKKLIIGVIHIVDFTPPR
jgi:hypothetical protein